MDHQEMRGRRALVLGLGKSGVAAARLLHREGAEVAVADGIQRVRPGLVVSPGPASPPPPDTVPQSAGKS